MKKRVKFGHVVGFITIIGFILTIILSDWRVGFKNIKWVLRFLSKVRNFLIYEKVSYIIFVLICFILVALIVVVWLNLLKVKKKNLEIEKKLEKLQRLGVFDKKTEKVEFEEIYRECGEEYFKVLDYIANQPRKKISESQLHDYYFGNFNNKSEADYNTMLSDFSKWELIKEIKLSSSIGSYEKTIWKITSKGLDFRKYYMKRQK